jgi:hypothetical protein
MAINYRSHFAYRIDAWDADGENVIEHLAGVEDLQRTNKPALRPLAIPLRTSESWRPSVAGYEHARAK